jgi:hypothetical protein
MSEEAPTSGPAEGPTLPAEPPPLVENPAANEYFERGQDLSQVETKITKIEPTGTDE